MSIESDLRKDGIRVVNILDTMSVNIQSLMLWAQKNKDALKNKK